MMEIEVVVLTSLVQRLDSSVKAVILEQQNETSLNKKVLHLTSIPKQ